MDHSRHETARRPPKFELVAGALCLDFVNTLDDRFLEQPKELLQHYVDLGRFAEDTRILSTLQVDRLFARSTAAPEEAKRALAAAIRLREAIYHVVWPIAQKKPVPRAALYELNQFVQEAGQHAQLVEAGKGFAWKFDDMLNDFRAPLWPIAKSAAELLVSEDLENVRACASETCQWLFLDTSKNHRRRWCDMKLCGNRAKVQRFYQRSHRSARKS